MPVPIGTVNHQVSAAGCGIDPMPLPDRTMPDRAEDADGDPQRQGPDARPVRCASSLRCPLLSRSLGSAHASVIGRRVRLAPRTLPRTAPGAGVRRSGVGAVGLIRPAWSPTAGTGG